MNSPFDNYDILKLIVYNFKDDPYNLLKLSHTSSFLRKEIIKNNIYPHMIDIIKNYNIDHLKVAEDELIKINKEKMIVLNIVKNFLDSLKTLKIYYNMMFINENKPNIDYKNIKEVDDQESIKFIQNQNIKYKQELTNLNEKIIYLNLRIQSLRKKNLFFNQNFIERKILQLPQNRWHYTYTYINVNKIKLKYIVKNDNGEYKYIENLYYNINSNMLHLTNCRSLKNSVPDYCIFIKKDDLVEHDNINFRYCKHCLNDIQLYLF
jgi:hypothetical protein